MEKRRDPGHKASKPRGSGTYWARVYCRCVKHGAHDIMLSAADDDAWVVGGWLARSMYDYAHLGVRYFTWFTRDSYAPPPADTIDGHSVEDDMPF